MAADNVAVGEGAMGDEGETASETAAAVSEIPHGDNKGATTKITSKKIRALERKIADMAHVLAGVQAARAVEEEGLKTLEAEFGPEISRISKEFTRMKERAVEENSEVIAKAKADAVKVTPTELCTTPPQHHYTTTIPLHHCFYHRRH
jgi:hypothetical protein